MGRSMARAVIVEDDGIMAEFLRIVCEEIGVDVAGVAHTAEDADRLIAEQDPSHVLMDVRLGGARDGVDIALDLHAVSPTTRVIFVTGSREPRTLARIEADHPWRVLIKPVMVAELREALTAA